MSIEVRELVDMVAAGQRGVLLDDETNTDVDDASKPPSHAALVAEHVRALLAATSNSNVSIFYTRANSKWRDITPVQEGDGDGQEVTEKLGSLQTLPRPHDTMDDMRSLLEELRNTNLRVTLLLDALRTEPTDRVGGVEKLPATERGCERRTPHCACACFTTSHDKYRRCTRDAEEGSDRCCFHATTVNPPSAVEGGRVIRCGRAKRNGEPCKWPVDAPGVACAFHRPRK
jgi:hypothetical protein